MWAITYSRHGAARDVLELGEQAETEPQTGEVRVRLVYSCVNPSDVKRRQLARAGLQEPAFSEVCPHSDGAGVIEAVGAGVDPARLGQRVWIWNGHWQRNWGTAAEKITLPEEQAVPLPDDTPFETGAQLGIPGVTAAHCVLGEGAVWGQWVLVHGGAGSVGYLAVQLAKWAGARVVATASPSGFEICKRAGADVVVDYRSKTLDKDIFAATDGALMDRIIDVEFGQNIATNAALIKPNGVVCVYGSQKQQAPTLPVYEFMFKAVTIKLAFIYILKQNERERAHSVLTAALEEAALDFPVDGVFPLSQTAAAHESVERGGRSGATLIDVTRL